MERRERVRKLLTEANVDGLLVIKPVNTAYVTGFSAATYSRPIVALVAERDVLVVPQLEIDHAKQWSTITDIRIYEDTKLGAGADQSPLAVSLQTMCDAIAELGLARPSFRLGFEAGFLTYDGFRILSELTPCQLVPTTGIVERARIVKTAREIELLKTACRIADYGMGVEVELSRLGISELEIDAEGNRAMAVRAAEMGLGDLTVHVGSRPIAGPRTVFPHAMISSYRVQPGDVIIHGAGASVGGYNCEVERTMFVGEPSPEARRAFEVMKEAQARAMAAMRPGVVAKDIDKIARQVIEDAGFGEYILHRTGHGMGREGHEAPHLALTDETVLEEGMVVSCEPGIYVPGLGGFRHSDTLVITKDGAVSMTEYPRELEDLVK